MSHLRSVNIGGSKIAYYEQGTGPVLVLLHGMFGDHLDWEPILDPLSREFRVIAPDLPGFGDSDKPDVKFTTGFFLDSLQRFLQRLGVSKSTLVGNSFGGSLAILFTIAHPQLVENLILVSSGGIRPFTAADREMIALRYTEQILGALTPEVQTFLLSPIFARQSPARERYIAKQNAKLARPDFPAYARTLARCAQLGASHDLVDRLAEIICPTLILWGDKDIVFPPEFARKALPRLSRGQMVLMQDCGHVPQLDDPRAFVIEVRTFVCGNGRAAVSAP